MGSCHLCPVATLSETPLDRVGGMGHAAEGGQAHLHVPGQTGQNHSFGHPSGLAQRPTAVNNPPRLSATLPHFQRPWTLARIFPSWTALTLGALYQPPHGVCCGWPTLPPAPAAGCHNIKSQHTTGGPGGGGGHQDFKYSRTRAGHALDGRSGSATGPTQPPTGQAGGG